MCGSSPLESGQIFIKLTLSLATKRSSANLGNAGDASRWSPLRMCRQLKESHRFLWLHRHSLTCILPLPALSCVQHSTAPSHSLVSQSSLGKSNPREGKIYEFFFFHLFFELEKELSGMPWAKPLASSCIFLTSALNSIRKPHMLYTNQHTTKKAFLFVCLFVFMNLQIRDPCKEHFWWSRQ